MSHDSRLTPQSRDAPLGEGVKKMHIPRRDVYIEVVQCLRQSVQCTITSKGNSTSRSRAIRTTTRTPSHYHSYLWIVYYATHRVVHRSECMDSSSSTHRDLITLFEALLIYHPVGHARCSFPEFLRDLPMVRTTNQLIRFA